MNQKNKHISNKSQEELNNEVLSRMEIPFQRDKEEVWETLSGIMDEEPGSTVNSFSIPSYIYFAASFVILLTVATLFMRYYTSTNFSGNEISSIVLPDGSTIEAEANTEISYHPYWWRFNREVLLEGEGYFEVKKGNTFTVISSKGMTEVLGTTFTVYTRSEQYRVSCYSGSVKVQSVNNTVPAVLMANEEVIIDKNGNYNVRLIDSNETQETIEEEYYFIFNSQSIMEVFNQIGDYYHIQINVSADLDYEYSGNLSKDLSIQDVLEAVCIPFEIEYAKQSNTEYTINP